MNTLFSCRAASRLASEARDHPLVLRQRLALRMHMAICATCRAYERHIILIDHLFQQRARRGTPDFTTSAGLAEDVRERIRARLRQPV
jgi:hypothetical protein